VIGRDDEEGIVRKLSWVNGVEYPALFGGFGVGGGVSEAVDGHGFARREFDGEEAFAIVPFT